MGQPRWLRASDRLERAGSLDRVVSPVQRIVRKIRPGRFRDGLHEVWLGHPLHPVLVQVPAGAWMSAALLGGLGGDARAADARGRGARGCELHGEAG